ncbi:unnamed protein product [Phytophthora fragariaefolia]|uniref:Unnamed protein product n=1 Tax=Phytophthora fragariaefolia TaxID=1490495 RepID=A0A9W6Y637_9STRA|nr:unnamed protein product [Phytophthora fragariaefolia]
MQSDTTTSRSRPSGRNANVVVPNGEDVGDLQDEHHACSNDEAVRGAKGPQAHVDRSLHVPSSNFRSMWGGDPLNITKKVTLTLRVMACGEERTVKLVDVYYAENVVYNLISYGTLSRKGFTLAERGCRRVLTGKNGGREDTPEAIMAVLDKEVTKPADVSCDVQRGTLVEFDQRLGRLDYDAIERHTKSDRPKVDASSNSPIDRDLLGLEGPGDSVRSLEQQVRDQLCGPLQQLLQREREYQNVDPFCKNTGVARQRSEARNQSSNGKTECMHMTIINMTRCMIFACGLPFNFWRDPVQYAAVIFNGAPTKSNPGPVSPIKLLTKQTPPPGKIVVFGPPCTVSKDPVKKNFTQRAQQGMIMGIGEETKGY